MLICQCKCSWVFGNFGGYESTSEDVGCHTCCERTLHMYSSLSVGMLYTLNPVLVTAILSLDVSVELPIVSYTLMCLI